MSFVLNTSHKEKAKLYVITSITNTKRYKSRYNLYHNFKKYISQFDCQLVTIEAAYGNRDYGVVEQEDQFNIRLRTKSELWHKENLLNIAVSRLPSDWEYVAFIDADVQFARPDWVNETLHMLQHHPVVQMFSEAQDLNPIHESIGATIKKHLGFAYCYHNNIPNRKIVTNDENQDDDYYLNFAGSPNSTEGSYWHPGFAWAWRREELSKMGGLIETALLGAGDNHMAYSLINNVEKTFYKGINPNYNKPLLMWQERANKYIEGNLGYVSGLILHYWHGKKTNRGYTNRWKILVDNNFDVEKDVYKDWQGLLTLANNNSKLQYEISKYFASRNEDSIDV